MFVGLILNIREERKMRKPCKRCNEPFDPVSKYSKICIDCWYKARTKLHRNNEKENDKNNSL